VIFSEEVQYLDVENTLSMALIMSCTSRLYVTFTSCTVHSVQSQNILIVITGKMVTGHLLKHLRNQQDLSAVSAVCPADCVASQGDRVSVGV